MREVNNSEDLIDTRDVEKKIDELQDEIDDLESQIEDLKEEQAEAESEEQKAVLEKQIESRLEDLDEKRSELKPLTDLKSECDNSEWYSGLTLIRDSYFQEYARDLADDLHGDAIRNASWPMDCIDWEQAARELQMDYSSVEFDGVTYWHDS